MAGESVDGQDADLDDGTMKVAGAMVAAGLLAALFLRAAFAQRKGQRQYHRPGRRMLNPGDGEVETDLRAAALPANVERFDAALRSLGAGLADRPGPLPDPVGALLSEDRVRLLLAAGCEYPPRPWEDHGDSWLLTEDLAVSASATQIAPFPSMAAIGAVDATHLLLDLERVGLLILTGDRDRRVSLLRYLASELALNAWSDDVEVLIAGFGPRETELLVALNPDRVRPVASVTEAAERLTRRTTSAIATLDHAGVPDALAGRIGDVAADSWMPQILLVAEPDAAGIVILSDLIVELDNGGRCAVGVVVTTPPEVPAFGRWSITVTPTGTLQLPFPLPYPPMAAANLTPRELERLAEMMRAARDRTEVAIPPAPEPEPWAQGTDAAGSLLDLFEEPTQQLPLTVEAEPHLEVVPTRAEVFESTDADLDADLAAWRAQDPARPRMAVLGPVWVQASGPMPEQRPRFHAEIIVYLAQRAGRGADRDLLDVALWPDRQVKDASRRVALTRVRRWLGETARGEAWLPDLDVDGAYRLHPGYLLDWHLFRRLRSRAATRGSAAAEDLRAALELVRGAPLHEADRPYAADARAPYPWLAQSDIQPDHLTSAIVDTGHDLATLCLAADDLDGVRWAVQQVWLADPDRTYDQPWRDLMLAQHREGQLEQVRATFAELMARREAEVPEDLAPDTLQLVLALLPELSRQETMAG